MAHANSHLFQGFFPIFEGLVSFVVCYLGTVPEQWRSKFLWDKYGRREEPGKQIDTSDADWWFEERRKDRPSRFLNGLRHRLRT